MKTEFCEYWVEDCAKRSLAMIYQIEILEDQEQVWLLRSCGELLERRRYLGNVTKRTKRGITFKTFFIDTKGTTVFIDRANFMMLDDGLYSKLILKD